MARSDRMEDVTFNGEIKAGLDEILRKSCALLARKGYHGTTMRDLARETGRSLAGLYHYFERKEDLLYLINYHGFTTLNDTWDRIKNDVPGARHRLYAFVFLHVHYFAEHMDEMRVMTWGTLDMTLERARVIDRMKQRYEKVARELVKEVVHETNGGGVDGRRLSRETFLLFGMMNWIFGWYSPRKHGAVDELVADIYNTFMYGLMGKRAKSIDLADINDTVSRWFRQNGAPSMW